MAPTKKQLPRLVFAFGMFVGHFCLTAHAFDSDLILPTQGKSNVVFEMRNGQSGIDPSTVLQVFVGKRDVCCEGKSPMAGRYSINERVVTFVPAFDFIEGQNYTVEVTDKSVLNGAAHFLKEFIIKRTVDNVRPEIISVFPSGPEIPENTLRFYIHFSTPMQPHVSTEYIKLLNSAGTPDTAAFMGFKQELWSEDRKRLTLLMDPGRIKRGVAQNLTLGPALQEGSTYSLVVEEGWPTANDAVEMPRFENVFTVSKALRTLPDPSQWTITSPKNRTNDPLVIEFDRPFDSELLLMGISVLGEDGRQIPGVITIEQQERIWRFNRKGTWRNSQIQIAVDTQLEDVAGNNFMELLDHSVGTEVIKPMQKVVTIDLDLSTI